MQTSSKPTRSGLFNVIYLGICFMLMYTACSAAQNLMTQIYIQLGHDNLGQITFFSLFFCCVGSSLVAAHFYKKLSVKTALVGSAMTIPVFMSGGVLVTYCGEYRYNTGICSTFSIYGYNIFVASIHGLGCTFLWLGQGNYVNLCANANTRGMANGIFYTLLKTCTILSSTITTFVFGVLNQFVFYIILMLISIVATVMFFFIPAPPTQEDKEEQQHKDQATLSESLRVFSKTVQEKRYRFVFAVMVFSGVGLALYSTSLGMYIGLTVDSTNVNIINQYTGQVFMVLAVGTIIAGPAVGYLADRYDKISLLGYTLTLIEIAIAVTILACFMRSYSLMLLCGLIWGLGDTAINTMTSVVIGSHFNNDVQILSCYRFFQPAGSLFMTLLSIFLLTKSPYLLIILIAGSLLLLQVYFYSVQSTSKKDSVNAFLLEEVAIMVDMKKLSLN